MPKYALFLLLIVAIAMCSESKSNTETFSRRDSFESQALQAYRRACYRLQELADWMSVLLKMKSFWTRSLSKRTESRLAGTPASDLNVDTEQLPSAPAIALSRKKRQTKGMYSCASLKNLHLSAQTYVQWQTELMKSKAVLGGNLAKTSITKLEDSTDAIKVLRERIKHLDILNSTSYQLLQNLKLGSHGLSLQLQAERTKGINLIGDAGKANNFLQYLQGIKDDVVQNFQNVVDMSEGLRKAQNLLETGDLLQSLLNTLDRHLLLPQSTHNSTEKLDNVDNLPNKEKPT